MKGNIGLSDAQRKAVVRILNPVLADEFVLYINSRRFHWTVEGPDFSELHELFEKQYGQLARLPIKWPNALARLTASRRARLRNILSHAAEEKGWHEL
jgi:hypothetical protein